MAYLKCPICEREREDAHPLQKTCSMKCGREFTRRTRGRDFFSQQSKRNHAAKAAANQRRALERWRARFPNVPSSVARAIYVAGYTAGHRRGARTGYAQGWSAAIGEKWERAS